MKKIVLFLLFYSASYADRIYKEAENWGVGIVHRVASVPYQDPKAGAVKSDDYVDSVIPLLFYENKYFFLDGMEGGIKFYDEESWRISLVSRLRFVDIPEEYQNKRQLDTCDWGMQLRYKLSDSSFLDTEVMSDLKGNYYGDLSYRGDYQVDKLTLKPYVTARVKTKKFNSYYYGSFEKIDSGVDVRLGLHAKYHIDSNFYFLSGAEVVALDSSAKSAAFVDKGYEYSAFMGIGFMRDQAVKKRRDLSIAPYIRISHGYATHSDIDQILGGNLPKESYGNTLTSIFYGYPLSDKLFSIPILSYITTGFVWHHESEVQDNLREYVLAIKAYYVIPLPIRFRVGLAEGVSYINQVTYIEKTDVNEDGFKESKVLNYLDFSFDVNVGDLIFVESFKKAWFGVNVHHRSGIFEFSSQYGRISGGSNYPSVHLQIDF